MPLTFRGIAFIFITTLLSVRTVAQEKWPSPEVARMYANAQDYQASGNTKEAIVVYRQAIHLAPGSFLLYKGLAGALYQSGQCSDAEAVLSPLISRNEADTTCFRLLAASQAARANTRAAAKTLQHGINRFPNAGPLYYETGIIYNLDGEHAKALNAWLDGIENAPACPVNYHDAALTYLASRNVLWGLLYGEMFLCMTHDTTGDDALKRQLLAGYQKLFSNIGQNEMPAYGENKPLQHPHTFVEAVLQIYLSLTPIVSDGISTENLTMVRVRFLLEWFNRYGTQYPFSLFSYQDRLTRNGLFDICNEWIFGKAENVAEYEAWNRFHDQEMGILGSQMATTPLVPTKSDYYNDRDMKGLFSKKHKK